MALSDPGGILASPLTIIDCSDGKGEMESIANIVRQNEVGRIIVGLPRSMDGSIGTQAKSVQAFVGELRRHTEVPIEFRDERLSTVSAKRLMQGVKKTKKTNRHDAIAAALVLQSYLDERV